MIREIVIGATDIKPNFNSRCLWYNADASENAVFYIFCMETPEIPEDLRKLIKLAREHHCEWLCLDCDGAEIDGLPTYNR